MVKSVHGHTKHVLQRCLQRSLLLCSHMVAVVLHSPKAGLAPAVQQTQISSVACCSATLLLQACFPAE